MGEAGSIISTTRRVSGLCLKRSLLASSSFQAYRWTSLGKTEASFVGRCQVRFRTGEAAPTREAALMPGLSVLARRCARTIDGINLHFLIQRLIGRATCRLQEGAFL